MQIREHRGFGHGLRPGTTHDMNCPSCQAERAAGKPPQIHDSTVPWNPVSWAGQGFTKRNEESTDEQAGH